MGRKAGITIQDIVDTAAAIADRDGLAAATLSAVAAELGIKTPSLYNHIAGLAGLRRQLALHAAGELTDAFASATKGLEPGEAIRSAAFAYRRFAAEHPGLYAALLPAPTQHEDPELYQAMGAPVEVIAAKLAVLGMGDEHAIHLIRALRALLHGFADLEAKRGFGMPIDLETSFRRAVDLMIDSFATSPT
jgi:AcrR family transcriptional regulator